MAVPRLDTTLLDEARSEHATSAPLMDQLERAAAAMNIAFAGAGTVFLAGDGGSTAHALQIAGMLKRSSERHRPLPESLRTKLASTGSGDLVEILQDGLRVVVLGMDPILTTSIDNDLPGSQVLFAQELVALARPGDVLVGITTNGRSPSIQNAARVARALEMTVILIGGRDLAPEWEELCDVVVAVPATGMSKVQLWHGRLIHLLCGVIESTCFPDTDASS